MNSTYTYPIDENGLLELILTQDANGALQEKVRSSGAMGSLFARKSNLEQNLL